MSRKTSLLTLALVGGFVGYRYWKKQKHSRVSALPETPLERRFGEETQQRDIVEEGSWESFPASDPPAY